MPRSLRSRGAPAAFLCVGLALFDPRFLGRMYDSWRGYDDDPFERDGGCAIVDVEGPLCQRADWCWDGYDAIEQRFAAALADPGTQAVVLRIDSPGGEAAGCFEAVRAMRALKAASGKPVVAFANELAASAAYALATVADQIWLPQTGAVGSIGVISVLRDRVQANAMAGLNVKVIASGAHKADGHPDVPLSTDVLASEQASVDRSAGLFADLVAESRKGLKPAAILALQAAVLEGDDAVAARLADGVGPWSEALSTATTLAKKAGRRPAAQAAKATQTTQGPRAQGTPLMLHLLLALGLAEQASEAEAIKRAQSLASTHDKLLALTGKGSAPEALGHVEGLQATAAAHAELLAAEAKRADETRSARVEAIYARTKDRGALTPAMEKAYRDNAPVATDDDVARLGAMLDALQPIPAMARTQPKGADTGKTATGGALRWENLSQEERHRLANDDKPAFRAIYNEYKARTGGSR